MSASVFVPVALIAWIPVSLIVMAVVRPVHRAVIFLTLAGWLFLPEFSIPVSGLPDYNKYTAVVIGNLLGTLLFDARRLLAFRARWFDLPVIVWCLCPMASSLANDLGPYDGVSACLNSLFRYGLPYLIGRIHLKGEEALTDLARGVVTAGLVYAPLCLWEVKMSPHLHRSLYGAAQLALFEQQRYGLGFRPMVFLSTPLETAAWMCLASLTAVWLWWSGVLVSVRGVPARFVVGVLFFTAVACQSVGATTLMVTGLLVYFVTRRTGSRIPLLVLLSLPLIYLGVRMSNAWSGNELVNLVRTTVNEGRAHSLQIRLDNEDLHVTRAFERPAFGWGGWGRSRIRDESGRDTSITDGLWIILLGSQGLVGLGAYTGTYYAPVLRLLRRVPARTLVRAEHAVLGVFVTVIVLQYVDNLANAFINIFYLTVVGALAGLDPARGRTRSRAVDDALAHADALFASGETGGAEALCRRVAELAGRDGADPAAGRVAAAEAYLRLGRLYTQTGRNAEAHDVLAAAVQLWANGVSPEAGGPWVYEKLAETLEAFARLLKGEQRTREAVEAWRAALAARGRIPAGEQNPGRYADSLNDLAWLLTYGGDPAFRDPATAVKLAEQAVGLVPDSGCYWNTLGAALYEAGNLVAAVPALTRSADLGGGAFEHYLLTLAHARLGNGVEAGRCFARAEAAAAASPGGPPELAGVRGAATAWAAETLAASDGPAR